MDQRRFSHGVRRNKKADPHPLGRRPGRGSGAEILSFSGRYVRRTLRVKPSVFAITLNSPSPSTDLGDDSHCCAFEDPQGRFSIGRHGSAVFNQYVNVGLGSFSDSFQRFILGFAPGSAAWEGRDDGAPAAVLLLIELDSINVGFHLVQIITWYSAPA